MRLKTIGNRFGIQLAKGLITPNEYAVVVKPRLWEGDGTVSTVIYAGGYSAGAFNLYGWFAYLELAKRGFCVVASDYGDTPTVLGGSGATGGPGIWGNDQAIQKVSDTVAYCENKLGTRPNHVLVMGGSQGGCTILNWARANKSKVKAALVAIPAMDTEDVRANNRQGYQASIEAAYGNNAGFQAARPTHVPVEYASSMSSIPMRIYAGEVDPICIYARTQAFADAHGSAELISLGASIGHSLGTMPWTQAVDWLESFD